MQQTEIIKKYQRYVEREGDTLGRLLADAERLVLQQTHRKLRDLGYEITYTQLQTIQQICLNGGQAKVLATRLQMTKQAVGQIITGLEKAGWVDRIPDPNDGRGQLIVYTANGCQLLTDILEVTKQTEKRWKKQLGLKSFTALKTILSQLRKPEE